jgi:hypothetical protein
MSTQTRRPQWTKAELRHFAEAMLLAGLFCLVLSFWEPVLFRLFAIVEGVVVIALLRGYNR